MITITLTIEGMMCPHCEAHMDEAIRKAFKVKKVTSSHTEKQTVILCKNDIDEQSLRNVVQEAGYQLVSVNKSTDA